jgi:hypothetical protein
MSIRVKRCGGLVAILAAASGVAGCSSSGGDSAADAGIDAPVGAADAGPDAGIDAGAGARCDPTAPFGPPGPVRGVVNTIVAEDGAHLTADELTIYFSSGRGAGDHAGRNLWKATRTSPDGEFRNLTYVPNVNSDLDESSPSLSADEKTLYLRCGGRDAPPSGQLCVASRDTTADDFSPRGFVMGTNVNVANVDEKDVAVTRDNAAIYLASNRSGDYDVFVADRQGDGSFSEPRPVVEINAADADDVSPTLSADGLTLYFASDRRAAGQLDIWRAVRSAGQPFGTPALVDELETDADETPMWLSPDGCVLYLGRLPQQGGLDILAARRGL